MDIILEVHEKLHLLVYLYYNFPSPSNKGTMLLVGMYYASLKMHDEYIFYFTVKVEAVNVVVNCCVAKEDSTKNDAYLL